MAKKKPLNWTNRFPVDYIKDQVKEVRETAQDDPEHARGVRDQLVKDFVRWCATKSMNNPQLMFSMADVATRATEVLKVYRIQLPW